MFAHLPRLFSRHPAAGCEDAFVEHVHLRPKPPRNRRFERLLVACWIVIAVKSAVVVWAVQHWHVPFSPLWVIVPTVMFAGLCTVVYLCRDE
jgi:hypothetical protein